MISIGQLYDEFTFGEHSPFAIKLFLQSALKNWKTPPTYLLLNGQASLDPRNYLGFGELDLVPTAIVPSSTLMTASDDWFSDLKENGIPTIATGRLPVSTLAEAQTVAKKISSYERQSTNGPWTSNALFVADKDDVESFTQDSQAVQGGLPAAMQITDIFVDNVSVTAPRGAIVNAINSGQVLVNYLGHGSEVAVLASSGLNQPTPQTNLDVMVVQNAFGGNGATLGDAIVKGKANMPDPDVRRTYVLLGDPAMKIRQPAASAVHWEASLAGRVYRREFSPSRSRSNSLLKPPLTLGLSAAAVP